MEELCLVGRRRTFTCTSRVQPLDIQGVWRTTSVVKPQGVLLDRTNVTALIE